MEQVKLSQDQYKVVLGLIKKTMCDFTHCERVLKEVDWDVEKAELKLNHEKRLFAEGRIKFDAKKNIV